MLDLLLCIGSIFGWALLGYVIFSLIIGLLLGSDILFDTHFGRKAIRKFLGWLLD